MATVNEFQLNLLLGFVAKFYCEVLWDVKLVSPILGKTSLVTYFSKTGSIINSQMVQNIKGN